MHVKHLTVGHSQALKTDLQAYVGLNDNTPAQEVTQQMENG